MTAENNFCFLRERIWEIKSALFYNLSDETGKTPVSVITVLQADEEGGLWFFIPKLTRGWFENEKTFPGKLQFYRKGKPFYLRVTGLATTQENKKDIHRFAGMDHAAETRAMQELLLVKFKMTKAEYFEQKPQPVNHSPIISVLQHMYNALFRQGGSYYYRPFELNPAA